jgi:hypothetical protein
MIKSILIFFRRCFKSFIAEAILSRGVPVRVMVLIASFLELMRVSSAWVEMWVMLVGVTGNETVPGNFERQELLIENIDLTANLQKHPSDCAFQYEFSSSSQ